MKKFIELTLAETKEKISIRKRDIISIRELSKDWEGKTMVCVSPLDHYKVIECYDWIQACLIGYDQNRTLFDGDKKGKALIGKKVFYGDHHSGPNIFMIGTLDFVDTENCFFVVDGNDQDWISPYEEDES